MDSEKGIAVSHIGVAFLFFAVCISGLNCLITLIPSFLEHFYCKKVFLSMQYICLKCKNVEFKNNDHIQLNSVDDIKEAITCDL